MASRRDQNTSFFHMKASNRRKKNKITRLTRPNGTVCEDQVELESMARDFHLYKAEGMIRSDKVLTHVPQKVTNRVNSSLNSSYSLEEVKVSLFLMFPTKAPGPDGFLTNFFQKHWNLCKEEITQIVICIINGEDSLEEINKTFIVIIPKVMNPTSLSQFGPICLCNVV